MNINPSNYETLGQFYLGRTYDLKEKALGDELVMYDSKDLVTHGVVLGMTGSGKTGLCITLLEEAAMDHIPAIIIDPKGDIANLMLTFPDLSPEEFRPWLNADEATKKNLTLDEFAEKTAKRWKDGLADWGQSPERIATLKQHAEVTIYTPGSKAGIPVSILGSMSAPSFEVMDDAEQLSEMIESTVSSLLGLIGVDADPIQSPEAIFLSNLFQHVWKAGEDVNLEKLISLIQRPPFDKIGVMPLSTFFSEKERLELAMKLNQLVASPSFASWIEGESLNLANMLYTPEGKPRMAIFSIAHLNDAERMFFVSLLLNQTIGWMRQQNGTSSLRAMLYMDEIFGYLPPSANPPSKRPLMTLLKQSRAFGLGCLLATQNPVDLDYKALSNIGTWFLGRLQTERDKMRVLDGLEGAAQAQNASFSRNEMEKMLSALGERVFLVNNIHEGSPQLMHVRWAMSFLAGPLTRTQIKSLMDPQRKTSAPTSSATSANPMSMGGMLPASNESSSRPALPSDVVEIFAPSSTSGSDTCYRPHLLRRAVVHYVSAKIDLDDSQSVQFINPMTADGIDWEQVIESSLPFDFNSKDPQSQARYAELPAYAMTASNYKSVAKEFSEWIYRNHRATVFSCPSLKEWSKLNETEQAFRLRLGQQAREQRDSEIEKIKEAVSKKIQSLQEKLRVAENQYAKEKSESTAAKMQAGLSIVGSVIGSLLGAKSSRIGSISKASSAFSKASSAFKQHSDVNNAEEKLQVIQQEIESIQQEMESNIAQITASFDPSTLLLETETLIPTKSNIDIQTVGLIWIS